MAYKQSPDMRVKELGHEAQSLAMKLYGTDGWDSMTAANAVTKEVIGFLPLGDGTNKVSDEDVAAAIPRLEVLAIVLSVLVALGYKA